MGTILSPSQQPPKVGTITSLISKEEINTWRGYLPKKEKKC